jgi:hypothetical protein
VGHSKTVLETSGFSAISGKRKNNSNAHGAIPTFVRIHFYRRCLRDEREAFHVESAAIAALSTSIHGKTENENDGMYLQEHGPMSLQEAVDRGAPPVSPTSSCRALLFNIGTSLAARPARTPADVYECIIAIGYSGDISRGAFLYPIWVEEPDGRMSFSTVGSNWLSENHELIGRNYSAVLTLTPWRLWNGVIGVEFDGAGRFCIFRGASSEVANKWYPCLPLGVVTGVI